MSEIEQVAVGRFTLRDAHIKSVKADMLTDTIVVSFALDLNEESLRARKHLRHLSEKKDLLLDLIIVENTMQPSFPLVLEGRLNKVPDEPPMTDEEDDDDGPLAKAEALDRNETFVKAFTEAFTEAEEVEVQELKEAL